MKAGFFHSEITPAVGTHKVGWLRDIVIDHVLDPLFVRVAVFERGPCQAALIQLDTLSIRWSTTNEIRRRIEAKYGFPGEAIMVAATHNHAGPAIANISDVLRDEIYLEMMINKTVQTFGKAWQKRVPARLGFGRCFEFRVSHNRRTVLRNGLAVTHAPGFNHPAALCVEGPIDPEVAVLAVRDEQGALLGSIVNFACHPVHHGGSTAASGGYPAALAAALKAKGCPETVFLNGACGNISPGNPYLKLSPTMEEIGATLAEDAWGVIENMEFEDAPVVDVASITVEVPVRKPSAREAAGKSKGVQRFIDPDIYERHMPEVLARLRKKPYQPAEVQVIRLGGACLAAIPAEYFTEFGLWIKQKTWPVNTMVVTHANGMLGYLPTETAFRRGGYETTLCDSSRMGPKTGKILAEHAIKLVECLDDY